MSEGISENTSVSELKISDTYINHDDFVLKVQEYANFYNFQIRKEKVKRDKNNNIRNRTILCSRSGVPEQKEEKINSRNHQSQRCNCPFLIRASINTQTGLWHTLAVKLDHNHAMVISEHKKFLYIEREIPQDIRIRDMDLRQYLQLCIPRCFEANEFINTLKQFKREIYGFEYEVKIDESTNELTQVI
ncbi:7054_t:CDS:1 [Funneliformis caledonium]|uniref:7054_t:CDS:1 n=1 Tax=Funneliformis caledonium TaxID=1117310 RepID=A0A9N9C825_9GLOM|nr:7054_t:CDS:1 [Funneliformis caledonium]